MNEIDDRFPFKRTFNLLKLVDFWKDAAQSESEAVSSHAKTVLAQLDSAPELLAEDLRSEVLEKYPDLLSVVMSPVAPIGRGNRAIIGATPPYLPECFYASEAFSKLRLMEDFDSKVRVSGASLTSDQLHAARAINAYLNILRVYYGASPEWGFPFLITQPDEKTGLARHFKVEFDLRFVDIRLNGELKELSAEEIDRLMGETMDIDLWIATLPPEQFEFHGFVVFDATEVTVPEELSLLKDDLLKPRSLNSPDHVDVLEGRLRVILGRPDLKLGLIGLERSEFGAISGAKPVGRSLLMNEMVVPECPNKANSYYAKALENNEPVIVTDMDCCKESCTGFEFHLMEQGLKNLLIAPLSYEDHRVGLLELASPNAGDINPWNAQKLMQVAHLFATAMNRELRERDNRIQAVIKKHYTAIHPSVEWRFRDSAVQYLDKLESGDGRADKEEIVFNDVYPLYGLSDIRNSSDHRVESIRNDLRHQLKLALAIVENASLENGLPIFDELTFQVGRQIEIIDNGLSSGDEVSVLEFLHAEIEQRLDHLATFGETVAAAVEAYRAELDPVLGVVYKSRKAYEESVARINETVVGYLEKEEDRAQEMFPHYFERYQTDGVDYNIYVGDSLVAEGGFDQLYLRNLRLWQLMTSCGIVWEMNSLKPTLPVPLDTAHLILVQSTPLAIRFREDEKQFDVDGAYNARYEIVKKRIDKAVIRGSSERLTQPGQIAIVYAQPREKAEYRRYLDYLLSAGYIEGEIEELELGDLQGVSGLHALRVTVARSTPETELQITPEGKVRPVKVGSAMSA